MIRINKKRLGIFTFFYISVMAVSVRVALSSKFPHYLLSLLGINEEYLYFSRLFIAAVVFGIFGFIGVIGIRQIAGRIDQS